MAKQNIAAELAQLSRHRFDAAAKQIYIAALLEGVSTIGSVLILVFAVTGDAAVLGAALVALLLVVAYCFRLAGQDKYDSAETIRRQVVLTEALGWPINAIAASEWMRQAGGKLVDRVGEEPLPDDYYASKEDVGGKRLAEMTAQSAFYTRHLYGRIKPWLDRVVVVTAALFLSGLVTLGLRATSSGTDSLIAQTVCLLVSLVVSWDILRWWQRLGGLVTQLAKLETELNDMSTFTEPAVLRLVMEYNCLMVAGFPVLKSMFERWHEEIDRFWKAHVERLEQSLSANEAVQS